MYCVRSAIWYIIMMTVLKQIWVENNSRSVFLLTSLAILKEGGEILVTQHSLLKGCILIMNLD